MRKYLINQTLTVFPWRVNYIKAWAKQSSHVLRSKFPTQSTAATLLCLVTKPESGGRCCQVRCISAFFPFVCLFLTTADPQVSVHTCIFKRTPKKFPYSKSCKHSGTRTHRSTTALSPWLGQAICLSPPSPLTAAVCPGWLWASQKSPSVIQQHINLLKSQPFQKGRRRSYFSAVVRGNIISLSQIWGSGTSALDDMRSEGEACPFSLFLCMLLLLLCTYRASLGAFSKSHSLSLSIASYLYEHTGLWERTVSGAAARAGPKARLEQYRLMAQETAWASGMNK